MMNGVMNDPVFNGVLYQKTYSSLQIETTNVETCVETNRTKLIKQSKIDIGEIEIETKLPNEESNESDKPLEVIETESKSEVEASVQNDSCEEKAQSITEQDIAVKENETNEEKNDPSQIDIDDNKSDDNKVQIKENKEEKMKCGSENENSDEAMEN